MLIERGVVPAFSVEIQLKHNHLRALLSCHMLVQKELNTYSRSSIGKTMPKMYFRQDYFKIMFCITDEG